MEPERNCHHCQNRRNCQNLKGKSKTSWPTTGTMEPERNCHHCQNRRNCQNLKGKARLLGHNRDDGTREELPSLPKSPELPKFERQKQDFLAYNGDDGTREELPSLP